MDRKKIMQQWDYWRAEIAEGNRSSYPRDWFESILDYYENDFIGESEKLNETCQDN